MPVTLITGTSSGIGLAAALYFAEHGHRVIATMRDPSQPDPSMTAAIEAGQPIAIQQLDVCDQASVTGAIGRAIRDHGGIDVLVNNAGIGGGSSIEDTPDEELRLVFETNFFGAWRCMRAVLPHMRERGSGAIVNITSMGGRVTFGIAGTYCASKFALEAASESLAIEVAPYGIRVATVEPGVIITKIGSHPPRTATSDPYSGIQRKFVMAVAKLAQQPTSAREVARVIFEAATGATRQLRFPAGEEAHRLIANREAMPDEDWLDLFQTDSDEEYYRRIGPVFGRNFLEPAPAR